MFTIISIILFITGLVLCYLGYIKIQEKEKINSKIEEENREIQNKNDILKLETSTLQQQQKMERQILENVRDNIKNLEETAMQSYEAYCDALDASYKIKEDEYNNLQKELMTSYENLQDKTLASIDDVNKDLDKIRQTRAAAIEAQRKEKEIEANICDYCVVPTQDELDDIEVLERIKPKLNQPRILCMLIWSTYYQKPLTLLCNNLLGTSIVTGIYKITNQVTKQVYIGQAADVASRWKQHAKCGLGIDTPAGNKLYKAIQEDGLHNFSFELLEKCPREQLNEKEAFYINLYQAYEFGYNSNRGIK